MNNHQESTFHPLGNFLKPSLSPTRTRFKKITKWAKIEFCESSILMQRSHIKLMKHIKQYLIYPKNRQTIGCPSNSLSRTGLTQ
ncbi:hypothetical protein THERMOT_286 [Bathymodiolus thermophilus thioautotrophic gill symbiont]|uniref:hypothetical protein n=1 Tax=Bathymodiolus thermophilus thioautotrophic gill symbiont TaxID=2360 RepID=UPI00192B7790|nr:hypothetical protein [Bathymodiolus thermophilus thioautotrophic gill symbiont]CAB5495299.1 hypothetical protein THERMOT_286 [Bathymodiolus thermophilus thioautotrophic gill symbiont]